MYVCMYVYIYNPTDRTYNWKVLLRSLFFDEVLFIVVVLSLSHIWLFVTPWTAARQASLSLTVSRSLLKLMSISLVSLSWWYHPTISSSIAPFFFCPQSFPASWSFLMSWLFVSGGQRIGASASVLPKSSQGWFPLGWTGLICLLSRSLSRVFFSTTVWKHPFFCAQVFFTDWLSNPYMRLIEKSVRTCILKSKLSLREVYS